MFDRYTIETVLKGNATDADYATVTNQLPLTLAPMAHLHKQYAPDYRVVNQAGATIGHGWSHTAKTTGQKYVAFHVDVALDRCVSGTAGRPAKTGSGWVAQLS
ncbi:DUF736 domain-containing protein [Aquamicrobium sp. NLF2-7]|uniref:DUF736 family protein n=1 Tax=Aquamicrobium sp. NLF2-7 TaxID=2918753 RepID=UPI001EFB855F|nr:DUF736 family protein [Aquamicrobium sp. NLF2-7]MCG8273937.1 DUF736 domain-containing protein [Aquamicrobium sp. NLF2-7]